MESIMIMLFWDLKTYDLVNTILADCLCKCLGGLRQIGLQSVHFPVICSSPLGLVWCSYT